jgi:hypothetical protein
VIAIVAGTWSLACAALVGFCIGIWLGVKNGKRIAHVDGRFDELVRQANLFSHAEAAKNTCVDATRKEKNVS